MGFGKSKGFKKLPTGDEILKYISDIDIFENYLGDIPRSLISSPFREDSNPSFSLYMSSEYGKVFFKDFATGESGDCFLFVMKLFNLSSKIEVFDKIAKDFNLSQFELKSHHVSSLPKRTKIAKSKTIIGKTSRLRISVTIRNWSLKDKEYWQGKYDLTKAQLEHCNIFPISHYFINGYCTKVSGIAYAFVEGKDGSQTFKIYQPEALKEDKWINNNDYSTWELWTQLPQNGKICIIGSSRKDSLVIKSLFPSKVLTSCSLQSEGVNPKSSVVDELRSRFEHVFIIYDNDFDNKRNPGRKAGEKLSKQTGFKQLEIPGEYLSKDPSDFVEKYGGEELRRLIKSLVKQNI